MPLSQKNRCLYCGNNQTNHPMDKLTGLFNGATASFNEYVLYSYPGRRLMHAIEKGLVLLSWIWFPLHIAKWSNDISKTKIARGKVLWEEAEKRGIAMEQLMVFGRATDIYRVYLGDKWRPFTSLPRPDSIEVPAAAWIDDKAVLKKKLARAGVSVSKGAGFFWYWSALRMFRKLEKPVVVKPRFGSRGRHTTTFVSTEEEFRRAFKVTKTLCPFVIVEEHLVGPVFRATAIDGEVRGLLAGEPPRIIGDGIHTILELIREKDARKTGEVKDVPVHALLDGYLKRRGFSRDSVLPKGKEIDLTEKIGVSYGGKSIEVMDIAHPKFIPALNKAAQFIDDPILGFDFIAEDITKDPDMQKWGIIECNAVPFINLHHDPLEGKPSNVASAVWDMYLKRM
ncbi:MAG: hypothetical protein PHS53_01795 [Candidatus Pacebacteria bacterium]|nr:hypothetical protein [Candidatus Paceibacterota bacterium]MDD5356861.1 hypothetical protein [Candidatus Paceibacterota bacterium]